MRNLTTELKVGLLILAGVSVIVYSSVIVTGWRPGIGDTYTVYVHFENAAGLLSGSPVQIAGVKIGQVGPITLQQGRAKVAMDIYRTITLRADATATIKSLGILGDKYIEINPGSSGQAPLRNGDSVAIVIPGSDLDSLVESMGVILNDFRSVSTSLRKVLGEPEGRKRLETILEQIAQATGDISRITDATNRQIDTILGNLTRFTGNLDRITAENRDSIKQTLDNLAGLSANLRDLTERNQESLDAIIGNLDTFSASLAKDGPPITADLRQILSENKRSLNNALTNLDRSSAKLDKTMGNLESVSTKMDTGQGSLGKLINDETTVDELNGALAGLNRYLTQADRIKLDIGGHVEYLVQQQQYKSYFTIRLQPLKDRYYLMQLIDNPRGKVEKKTIVRNTNGTQETIQETTTTSQLQLSLLIAQRYYDTVLKGGIIENSFGLGVEQLFGSTDQYRIGLDVWDFGGDLGPHVKLDAYWRFLSNAFLVVGGDNLASKEPKYRDAFFGIGLTFNEDTLKPMFSSLPINQIANP